MRSCMLLNSTTEIAADLARAARARAAGACEVLLLEPGAFADCARRAAKQGAGRIIVGGGDGSLHAVVNALAPQFGPELALLPLGTANDLARILDLDMDEPGAAIDLCLAGRATPIDVLRVTSATAGAGPTYAVNACIGGSPGTLSDLMQAEDKRRWGSLAYWISAVKKLAELTTHRARIRADNEQIELTAYGLSISNGRYAGGAFPIAPGAWADDGLLDLMMIPADEGLDTLAAGLHLLFGAAQTESPYRRHARRVELEADPPMPFSIDGEPHAPMNATFEVLPRAIRVVAGPNAIGLVSKPDVRNIG